MPTSVNARRELTTFLGVKADSPKKIQVKSGKLMYDSPKPSSLDDQAVPNPS